MRAPARVFAFVPAALLTGALALVGACSSSSGSPTPSTGAASPSSPSTPASPTTPITTSGRCGTIMESFSPFAATVGVTCDGSYAYISSNGMPAHQMMTGIVATNQQVPIPQDFTGSNAWRIPLTPVKGTATTSYDTFNGPIGIAVNGVPIFNPDRPGSNGPVDTVAGGELDVCNGHAGRADDYHYHAAPTCMMKEIDATRQPIGWAVDGYGIYGFTRSDGSTPSRDACGGETDPAGDYRYHVTSRYPYILGCFTGRVVDSVPKTTAIRPAGDPLQVSNLVYTTDADGWLRMTYTSSRGTSTIRYRQASARCWDFEFIDTAGVKTAAHYCR